VGIFLRGVWLHFLKFVLDPSKCLQFLGARREEKSKEARMQAYREERDDPSFP